ncbi:MAG: T9SS type A sorting domain-containing protein [Ferruginibacter sp.]
MEMKVFRYVLLLLFFIPSISHAQEDFDFYLSNKGNDSYPGTSKLSPKKTIDSIAPLLKRFSLENGRVKVGLKSGDIFDENLVTSYPIELNSYTTSNDKKDFAILNGSKEFNTGWILQPATNNTFRQAIPYSGFTGYGINGIGSYSFIYVFEIDKVLEKTAPFTARKLLKFIPDLVELESTPGSFAIPVNSNENPMPVFIHTSEGKSPNGNPRYRYEVAVRDWAVNSTYQEGSRFENLWVRGFGAGNGMLPGGSNSHYNKIIFGPGAAIHHLGVRSGTIDHSLFLPGAKNTSALAVVFYDVEGLGRHCTIKNSMFLDINEAVYAHTSLGTNYGAVELDNVTGFASPAESGGFIYTSNTDSVILNKVYTDGYNIGYNYGNARYALISNCWFKNVNTGIAYRNKLNPVTSTVSNVFIKTNGASSVGIVMARNTSLTFTNSIIHLFNTDKNPYLRSTGDFVQGGGDSTNRIIASGNIFICDIEPSKYLTAANTNTSNGTATSKDVWKNNVYILLRGANVAWMDINGNNISNIQSFTEWKRISGQDKNSLFFDLRYDVRGLKAIFIDPDNGNYDLANTTEGKQVAALRAGMSDPLTCFLQRPTFEEAADLVRNNKVLSANTCRNPCQQNTIRVNNTFDITAISSRQMKLQWNISEQQNIDRYELQRSTGSFLYTKVRSVPVSEDSLYSFIDDVQPGIAYQYRLMIVPKAGGKCYSDTRSVQIKDNKAFTIYPNPSTGKVSVSMSGYTGGVNFVVCNSLGETVLVKEGVSLNRTLELDLSNQPKGIYLLKIETSNSNVIQKILIQ